MKNQLRRDGSAIRKKDFRTERALHKKLTSQQASPKASILVQSTQPYRKISLIVSKTREASSKCLREKENTEKSLLELESQWKNIKKAHNFENRSRPTHVTVPQITAGNAFPVFPTRKWEISKAARC